jgi:hypothetical protein
MGILPSTNECSSVFDCNMPELFADCLEIQNDLVFTTTGENILCDNEDIDYLKRFKTELCEIDGLLCETEQIDLKHSYEFSNKILTDSRKKESTLTNNYDQLFTQGNTSSPGISQ